MSPERMTQLDRLLQSSIDAAHEAMELSVQNAQNIAGLLEFANATKERLSDLGEASEVDTERGLQCRKEVESMIGGVRQQIADLKSRFNYVLGGVAVVAGLWVALFLLFIKHILP